MPDAPAPYLDNVVFNGWDYVRPLPADVRDDRYLHGSDPWLVFCCILERAKLGDFEHRGRLPSLWSSGDADLRFCAQYVFAFIARAHELHAFDTDITGDDVPWRMETADHAALSGSLVLVDTFIKGYRAAFGETTRSVMEDGLSSLLVCDPESRLVVDCLLAKDRTAGEARLHSLARQQAEQFGDNTSFYQGKPLTLTAVAADVGSVLGEDDPAESFENLQSLVTRLQTMVGFSQAGMFDEDQRTWNEPAIRAQITACEGLQQAPGTRHFFGHPAPL